MNGLLNWDTSTQFLAQSAGRLQLRLRLLRIADTLGSRLLGMGLSPDAWRVIGVSVIRQDLRGLSGYCAPSGRDGRVVYVEAKEDPRRQRFTVAHELGHLLLGEVDRTQLALTREYEERLCDEFASRVLMPAGDLARLLPVLNHTVDDLLAMSSRYGVSLSVVLGRVGNEYAQRGMIVFASSHRGHPARPDEIALRAHGARCGQVFVPELIRVGSLGLEGVAELTPTDGPGAVSGHSRHVSFRLWQPTDTPRTGELAGPAKWESRTTRTGVTLVKVQTAMLEPRWAPTRTRTSRLAALAA